MHLLQAQQGALSDGSEPVDLGQPPGDLVYLTFADTEISALLAARDGFTARGLTLRAANIGQLSHPFSVDLYIEKTLAGSKFIILRLLGGEAYWRYGLEQITALARGQGIDLAVLPGDMRPDPALASYNTVPPAVAELLFDYARHGGAENMNHLLAFTAAMLPDRGHAGRFEAALAAAPPAVVLANAGLLPVQDQPATPVGRAAVVFYRALLQSEDLRPVHELQAALQARGLAVDALFVSSLKDPASQAFLEQQFAAQPPGIIINLTSFAASTPGRAHVPSVLEGPGVPVLQAILASCDEAHWRADVRGLPTRDIAMHIALPEVDGRLITRAISCKQVLAADDQTRTARVIHQPLADRIALLAEMARHWVRLQTRPPGERRIALLFANYPALDGRIGNGIGLDTPAAACHILDQMAAEGYAVPCDAGEAAACCPVAQDRLLMQALQLPPAPDNGQSQLSAADYRRYLTQLVGPERRAELDRRWGAFSDDPLFDTDSNGFCFRQVALGTAGRVMIAIQPGRGWALDARTAHHDLELVPPHGYLAFYFWLRFVFAADAVIHLGKHGNLEWLPGKALALSGDCFPDIALGPLPNIYPFIVNDPGEGTQAKRRTAAVIIDHMTPPLRRAGNYGELARLEQLIDEFYQAALSDPRRTRLLGQQILDLAARSGLNRDCDIAPEDSDETALQKLDNFLCELKEVQIRDGLHVFGRAPAPAQQAEWLLALTRLPRGNGQGGDASLLQALAYDLALNEGDEIFDRLDLEPTRPWQGARPAVLAGLDPAPWRTHSDTAERLEKLALALIGGDSVPDPSWHRTHAVLAGIERDVRPLLVGCGQAEINGLLRALDGRFVPPGPSGAPSRGRVDVLPTGRNFYSVDPRAVPTRAAFELGLKSADLLVTQYRQEHGRWPQRMAITAWGTANMRTGGDDLAQAMALIGVRPRWDGASARVTGYEIISLSEMGRPRIDILFRISGFFRDAFPAQIHLLAGAVQAVAQLDEPDSANPLAARRRALRAAGEGAAGDEPELPAIFGAAPGHYGAGLKDLIETGDWQTLDDLADSYLAASCYSYGLTTDGAAQPEGLRALVGTLDAIVHNQDAREFDLLDSDDFYQFEGGLAAAARVISGAEPALYHNDHANPARPNIRALGTELAQIVRARAVNPAWLAGMRRHGYRGAAEMARTVTLLFAFAALTEQVGSHQFDLVYEAYIDDEENRGFLQDNNPAALKEMAARFIEAMERGLWQPRQNSARYRLDEVVG